MKKDDSYRKEMATVFKKKHISIPNKLLILDAFVGGGFVTWLLVNRLLDSQLNDLASYNSTAAETILDVISDLLPYYAAYAGVLLILILITIGIWIWRLIGD